jgi:hypothetical protein
MENKIKAEFRQTNIQNLNELTEEQKFEFQKALEKELESKCEHHEVFSIGNGFTYSYCSKCGEELS